MNDISAQNNDEARGTTQSARIRSMCSGADDDEPEGLLLGYLNRRSTHSCEGSRSTPPAVDETDRPHCAAAVPDMLSLSADAREDTQSARIRHLCSATDDDEPEVVVLELLEAHSSRSHKIADSATKSSVSREDMGSLDSLNIMSVAEPWDDESTGTPHRMRSMADVQLDCVDRSKFLYRNDVGSKSAHAMKNEPTPIVRQFVRTSSMHDVPRTPTRLRREVEPCSPGLLPSGQKDRYTFSEEKSTVMDEKESSVSDEEFDRGDEFGYVNSLFSKIRHNRIGYVTAELERGCDPSIKDAHGNTMLHICAQNNLKKIAKTCLQHNCDINAIDIEGRTPLDICDKLQFKALGDFFIFNGAENGFNLVG